MLSVLLHSGSGAISWRAAAAVRKRAQKRRRFAAGANARGTRRREKEIVTIKLSHNSDYVTIPEAVMRRANG